MKTIENLKAAFAGESQANRKYLAFAKKADDEGYHQVAKLFRAAAEAETVHALHHLSVLRGVGSTAENLKAAIEGESYEQTEMYPKFIEEAKAEGEDNAVTSFYRANEVEKIHNQLYRIALGNLGKNPDVDYYVCQVCGNTVEKEVPEYCAICQSSKGQFKKIL